PRSNGPGSVRARGIGWRAGGVAGLTGAQTNHCDRESRYWERGCSSLSRNQRPGGLVYVRPTPTTSCGSSARLIHATTSPHFGHRTGVVSSSATRRQAHPGLTVWLARLLSQGQPACSQIPFGRPLGISATPGADRWCPATPVSSRHVASLLAFLAT